MRLKKLSGSSLQGGMDRRMKFTHALGDATTWTIFLLLTILAIGKDYGRKSFPLLILSFIADGHVDQLGSSSIKLTNWQ